MTRGSRRRAAGISLAGLTGFRHQDFGLADLIQPARYDQLGVGSVATVVLPAGPARPARASSAACT